MTFDFDKLEFLNISDPMIREFYNLNKNCKSIVMDCKQTMAKVLTNEETTVVWNLKNISGYEFKRWDGDNDD